MSKHDEQRGTAPADATLAIEEHAKNMGVAPPVFLAVMQAERWAGGKRTPEAVFRKAVEAFLQAPIGGR